MNKQMDKQSQIVEMFDAIAKDYDKANRILSLGIDISWRINACQRAFEALGKNQIDRIVDVACGSGDMILHWQKQAKKHNIALNSIIGVDPSVKMLEVAKTKLQNARNTQNAESQLQFFVGQAQNLKMIESQSVDILSIAYGLRNVVECEKAIAEFSRVLKNGGIIVVLDFFKKQDPSLLDYITSFYTKHILPLIGGVISKNYVAYKYLPDSMDSFLTPQELAQEFAKVGIRTKLIKSYSANISHLILGIKQEIQEQ